MLLFVLIFFLIPIYCYPMMISEVVFNFPYEKEKNQYIEIVNLLPFTVDLRNYEIYLQGYKINLTTYTNSIESPVTQDSFYLEPGRVAIILPYEYLTSSMPFYFSNVTVLFSTTKYLGKNGPIKREDIGTIKIVSNNVVIDSLPSIQEDSIGIERTLTTDGTNTTSTEIISPGYVRTDEYIYFGKLLYDFPSTGEIFLHSQTNANQVNLEILGRGEVTLTKVSENTFKGTIIPIYNGEKVIAKSGNLYTSTRFLNLFEIGGLDENLVINEVCLTPSKSWFSYFSSGLFSDSVNTSDKYIEIINISQSPVPITNMYIQVMGSTNYNIKISDEIYYSSKFGYSTEMVQISPGEYVVAKAGDIKAESLIMLKDNHPYRGGKVLSFVEMKGMNIFPLEHSNYYTYESNRTISLLPDGLPTRLGGKYRNYYETPSAYNGFSSPTIIVDNEYKKVGESVRVWIVTKEKEPYTEITLKTKNSGMFRTFLITNQGFWYYREFKISDNGSEDIVVNESDEIELEFNYNGQKYTKSVFLIPGNSYLVNETNNILLKKGIVKRGDSIVVMNVSTGDEIIVLTSNYYPVMKMVSDRNGIFEFSTSNLVRGLYILVVRGKKGNFVNKFFVK